MNTTTVRIDSKIPLKHSQTLHFIFKSLNLTLPEIVRSFDDSFVIDSELNLIYREKKICNFRILLRDDIEITYPDLTYYIEYHLFHAFSEELI